MDNFTTGCRFDAYAATLRADVRDVLDAFEGLTPGAHWERLARAPLGYGFASQLVDPDGALGVLWWGGQHELPHASFQGDGTPAAAALLRECFPAHAVTRADPIFMESAQPGAYDVLQAAAASIARRHRVEVGTAGDHVVTLQGRTIYLGSPKSPVRLRLYDKAAELRATLKDPRRLAAVPPELARMEAQIRPKGEQARSAAAVATPEELLGSAKWLRDLAGEVAGLEVERFDVRPTWRESDDSRAWQALLAQYGALLERVAAVQGWECLGLQIRDDLAERRQHAKH